MAPSPPCIVLEFGKICGLPVMNLKRMFCVKHYARFLRDGDPLIAHGNYGKTPQQRFSEKWERAENECHLWTGCLGTGNYGSLTVDHKACKAHRWAWEHFVGPIPEGWVIDHLCHNRDLTCPGGEACIHRRCVNIDHLEPVPAEGGVNINRSPHGPINKTHCKKGHPFDEANTAYAQNQRVCRICRYNRSQAWLAKVRAS